MYIEKLVSLKLLGGVLVQWTQVLEILLANIQSTCDFHADNKYYHIRQCQSRSLYLIQELTPNISDCWQTTCSLSNVNLPIHITLNKFNKIYHLFSKKHYVFKLFFWIVVFSSNVDMRNKT